MSPVAAAVTTSPHLHLEQHLHATALSACNTWIQTSTHGDGPKRQNQHQVIISVPISRRPRVYRSSHTCSAAASERAVEQRSKQCTATAAYPPHPP